MEWRAVATSLAGPVALTTLVEAFTTQVRVGWAKQIVSFLRAVCVFHFLSEDGSRVKYVFAAVRLRRNSCESETIFCNSSANDVKQAR